MHTSLRAAAGAAALALFLVLATFGTGIGPASAQRRQFPPETTVAPGLPTETTVAPGLPTETTAPGVLVPDPNATATPTTPTTVGGSDSAVTQEDQTPAADSSGDPEAERTVWVTIAALGVVAFLIMVLTIIYARHTRPDRWHGGHDDWDLPDGAPGSDTSGGPDGPGEVFAPTAARSVFEHHDDEQGFWWAED